MKTSFKVLSFVLATFLTGCNPEVFIADFLPENPKVTVEEGKSSIFFKSDNWGILSLVKDSQISAAIVPLVVYDLEGKRIGSLPLEERALAVLSVNDKIIDFKIEKRDPQRLEVICEENMEDHPACYFIEVGNVYERKWINVLLPPTQKYQIDSVVYQWKQFIWSDSRLESVRSLVVNNSVSPEPVTLLFRPYEYKEAFRKVECYYDTDWHSDGFRKIFGKELPPITIPDVVDSQPVPGQTRIRFGEQEQLLDAGLDKNKEVEVTVRPGDKRRIEIYLCLEEYSVPLKVYASNPETGRRRIFSANLHSTRPFDFLILKKIMDNEETGS